MLKFNLRDSQYFIFLSALTYFSHSLVRTFLENFANFLASWCWAKQFSWLSGPLTPEETGAFRLPSVLTFTTASNMLYRCDTHACHFIHEIVVFLSFYANSCLPEPLWGLCTMKVPLLFCLFSLFTICCMGEKNLFFLCLSEFQLGLMWQKTG